MNYLLHSSLWNYYMKDAFIISLIAMIIVCSISCKQAPKVEGEDVEDEKFGTESTLDFTALKTSLLRVSLNKCKNELGSPDIDGLIREFDDGNVYTWIYLNRNVHSENMNKQHLVVFIKALGHGRGIVEDLQSMSDNEKVYYDYGNLFIIVKNGGKDVQSNSRSFHSTAQKNN